MSSNSTSINVHPNSAETRTRLATSLCANSQIGKWLLPELLTRFHLGIPVCEAQSCTGMTLHWGDPPLG